jgi:hypothetical protein
MSTSATPGPAPEISPAPPLSEGQRIINVFIAPSATFSDLKRKTTWLNWFIPWLVIAVVAAAFGGIAGQKVGFRQITENQARMQGSKMQDRMAAMPPEQRERVLAVQTGFTKGLAFGFPLVLLVILVIYAAILLATFNFGMGEQISFVTSLAIVTYAHLPVIIKSLLAVVALYAGADPEGFTFQNPVASNLGFLVDINAHPALYTLASGVDIFVFWAIILTGIGFSCVSKVKKSTAVATVFAWYAVFILATTGLTALFR